MEEEDGRCGGLEVVVVLNLSYFEEFLMIIEAIERIHDDREIMTLPFGVSSLPSSQFDVMEPNLNLSVRPWFVPSQLVTYVLHCFMSVPGLWRNEGNQFIGGGFEDICSEWTGSGLEKL